MIMVGGTKGVDIPKLATTLGSIRESTDLPLVIFPASSDLISERADAILMLSLMNSRNHRFIWGEAVRRAREIRGMDIETISTGYVVVEPGMLVGEVGEVDLIARDDPDLATSYGITAELMGMDLFYLEGGSGVKEPIPPKMISSIKEEISIPLVVGGGIRTPKFAAEAVRAGADIVVTGNVVEREGDITCSVRSLTEAILDAGDQRDG